MYPVLLSGVVLQNLVHIPKQELNEFVFLSGFDLVALVLVVLVPVVPEPVKNRTCHSDGA